jgi:hypothetical protein
VKRATRKRVVGTVDSEARKGLRVWDNGEDWVVAESEREATHILHEHLRAAGLDDEPHTTAVWRVVPDDRGISIDGEELTARAWCLDGARHLGARNY